ERLLALLRLAAALDAGQLDRLSPAETSALLRQLEELAAALRPRAELTLGRVSFCRRIESFGLYDPWPPGRECQGGTAGRPGERVQVYAEVRNLASQPRNGLYETVLSSRLEIHAEVRNPDGQARWQRVVDMNLGPCIDRSRTPRHDYFLNFQ